MNDESVTEGRDTVRPVLAICYDFDKTLTPDNMQEQGFTDAVGVDAKVFWDMSNALAKDNDMDQIAAYMYSMVKASHGKLLFTKESLKAQGRSVRFFEGVTTWFERINAYADDKGIDVEHYIISSGLKEIIEGTEIADNFKMIYACSFYFDEAGVAVWPAQVVNYTNKTQFLFRIQKGALDVNDDGVNAFVRSNEYRVPFRNIVYIGDSDTDVPCMKLVNINGGHSIGVYAPGGNDTERKQKVYRMLDERRIRHFVAADYTDGSSMDNLMKRIIDRTAANEELERLAVSCEAETADVLRRQSEEEQRLWRLVDRLETVGSFANTHRIIGLMRVESGWSLAQKEKLMRIALDNSQVRYILSDTDVAAFYESLFDGVETESVKAVKDEMRAAREMSSARMR